jgi:hypothetical protein
MQWGQLTFTSETLDQFEGNVAEVVEKKKKQSSWSIFKDVAGNVMKEFIEEADVTKRDNFVVDSRDIGLHYHYNAVMRNPTPENHKALADEVNHRMKMDKIFAEAFPAHMAAIKKGEKILPTDFDCYRNLMNKFEEKCEKLDDYSMKYAAAFVAECNALKAFPSAIDSTMHRLDTACKKPVA